MPWSTPTLKDVRKLTRDYVLSQLGAKALIPNSALRIMSDAKSGLAHLTLLYIDWLAKQLLPDTAEQEWLDRHGNIWLRNADGSKGRKVASFASGTATITGAGGVVIPQYSVLSGYNQVRYQTTAEAEISAAGLANVPLEALTAGVIGNLDEGSNLSFEVPISGADLTAAVVSMTGGADVENDDLLRERVLFRIQNPPMGGDKADYERWATAVAGVTRAWCYPLEMGIGTVTVRFMMDDLRADLNGIPMQADIQTVTAYIDSVRPVAVKDRFIVAPIPFFYNVTIRQLTQDTPTVRARIESAIKTMERRRLYPGCTLYRSWIDEAISGALGEDHHELDFSTLVMPSPGHIPMLDTISYETA